ncbi:zinc finger CCCH domain-containing protein 2 [Phtheirospermum japonicum]|uniref:Zinc finger CCCH domain-containing protein 2 n=1 Tax=Phtheirospermum japonicum TaxID=374723 RepID=A0A830BNP2_9LAMI|nr:zinc finger CCCH domain-containing protein 2 [Phtheirospermum japonicum]
MFEFKVKKCARARSHDWTECPFAHPVRRLARGIRVGTTTPAARAPTIAGATPASTRMAFLSAGSPRRAIVRRPVKMGSTAGAESASSLTRKWRIVLEVFYLFFIKIIFIF